MRPASHAVAARPKLFPGAGIERIQNCMSGCPGLTVFEKLPDIAVQYLLSILTRAQNKKNSSCNRGRSWHRDIRRNPCWLKNRLVIRARYNFECHDAAALH